MADDLWDLSALQDQDAPPNLTCARDRLGMKMMANKQLFGSVLQSEHNVADRFLPAASGQNQQPLSSSQDGRQTSPVYNRPYGSGSRPAAMHAAEAGPGPAGGNPIRQMHQYLNVLGLQTAPPGSGPGGMTQSGRPVVGILKKPVGILKKPSASASSSQSVAPADTARHQPLPSRPMAMSSLQQASLAGVQNRPPVAGHPQLSQASLTDSLPIAPTAGKLPSGASAQSARSLTSSHPLHPSMVSLDRRQALAAALQLQRFSLTDSLPIKPLEAVAPRQQASAPMSEKDVLSLTNALPLYSLRDKLLRLSSDNESKSSSSNRLETDTPPASGKAGQDRSEEGKTRKSKTRSHHSPRKSSDRRRGRDTEDLPPVQYPASVVPRPQRSEAAPQTAATVRASDGIAFVKGSTSSSGMITYKYGVAPSAKPAATTPLSVVGGSSQILPPAASSTPMMLAAATANKLRAKLAYSEMVASATLPGSARLVSTSSRRRKSRSKSPGSNELWSRARDNESPQRSQSRSVKNLERSRDSRSSSRTVTVGDAAKKLGSRARDRAEKSRSRSRGRSRKSRSGSRDRKRKSRSRSKDRRRKSRSRSRDRNRKSRSRSRDRKRKSRSRSKDRRRKSRSRSRDRKRKSRSPSRDRKRKSRSRSRDRKRKSRSRSRGRSRKSRSNSRDRRRNSRSSSRDRGRKSRSRDRNRKSTSRSRDPARKSRSRSMSQKRLLGDHAQSSQSGPRSLPLRRSRSQERSRKKSHSQDRLGRRSRSTDRIPRSQDRTQQLPRSRSRTPKRIRHSRSPIASYRRSSQSPPLRRARRSNSPVPSDRLAPGNPWRMTTYDGRAFLPPVPGLDRPGMESFRGEVIDSRLGYGTHGVPVFPPGSYPSDGLAARRYPSDGMGPHFPGAQERMDLYFPGVRERMDPRFRDARERMDYSVARARSPHSMFRTALVAGRARSPDRSIPRLPGDREPSPHSLFRTALAAGQERARWGVAYGEAPQPVPMIAPGYAEAYYPRPIVPLMETSVAPLPRDPLRRDIYPRRSVSPVRNRRRGVSPLGRRDERLLSNRFPSASPERRNSSPGDKPDEARLSAQRSSSERRSKNRSHERRAEDDKDTKKQASSERKRSASGESERSESRRSSSRRQSKVGKISEADDDAKRDEKVVGREVSARKERSGSVKQDGESRSKESEGGSGRSRGRKDREKEASTGNKDAGKSSEETKKVESSEKSKKDVHKSSKTKEDGAKDLKERSDASSKIMKKDAEPSGEEKKGMEKPPDEVNETTTHVEEETDADSKSEKKAVEPCEQKKDVQKSKTEDGANESGEKTDDNRLNEEEGNIQKTEGDKYAAGTRTEENEDRTKSLINEENGVKGSSGQGHILEEESKDMADETNRSPVDENDAETTSKGRLPEKNLSKPADKPPETNASVIGDARHSVSPERHNKQAEKEDGASLSVSDAGCSPKDQVVAVHAPDDETSKTERKHANSEQHMVARHAQQTGVPEGEAAGNERSETKWTAPTVSKLAVGDYEPEITGKIETGEQEALEATKEVAPTDFVGPKSAERGEIKCSGSESDSPNKTPEAGAESGATESTVSEPKHVDSGNSAPHQVSVEFSEPNTKEEIEIHVSEVELAVVKPDENTTDQNPKTTQIREIGETIREVTTNKSTEGNDVKRVSESEPSSDVSEAVTPLEATKCVESESGEVGSAQAVATKADIANTESGATEKMERSDSGAGLGDGLDEDPTDELEPKSGEGINLNSVALESELSSQLPEAGEPKSAKAMGAEASKVECVESAKPEPAVSSTSETSKKLDVSVHGIEEVDVAALDAAAPGEVLARSSRPRQRDRSERRRRSRDRHSRTRSCRERGRSRDKSRESSSQVPTDALLAGGFRVVDATSDTEEEAGVDSVGDRALDQGELRSRGLSLWDARNERDATKRRRSSSPKSGKDAKTKRLYTVRDGRVEPLEGPDDAGEAAKPSDAEKQTASKENDGPETARRYERSRGKKRKFLPPDTVFYARKGYEMIKLSVTQKRWLLLHGANHTGTPPFFRKLPGDAEGFELVNKFLMMGVLKRQQHEINFDDIEKKIDDRYGERAGRSDAKEKREKVMAAGSSEPQKSGSQSPKRSSRDSRSPKRTRRRSSSPRTSSRHRYSPGRTDRDASSSKAKSRYSRSPKRKVRDTSSPRSRLRDSPSPKRMARGISSSRAASRDSCSPKRRARDRSPKTKSRGSPSPKRIARGSYLRDVGLGEVHSRRRGLGDHLSPESMKRDSGRLYESARSRSRGSDISSENASDWKDEEYPSTLPDFGNNSYRNVITIQCAEIDWSKTADLHAGDTKDETAPTEDTTDAEEIRPESQKEPADSSNCNTTVPATEHTSETVAPGASPLKTEIISDEDNDERLCNDREDEAHAKIISEDKEATGTRTDVSTAPAGDQREAVIPKFAPLVTDTISDGEDKDCFELEDGKRVEIPDDTQSEAITENTSSEARGVSSRKGESSDGIEVDKLGADGELEAVGEAGSARESSGTLLKSWKLEDGEWKEVWTADNSIKKNSIKLNLISKLDGQPVSSKIRNPACEEPSAEIKKAEDGVPPTEAQVVRVAPADGNSARKDVVAPARKEASVKITFKKKPVKPKRKEVVHVKPKEPSVSPGESGKPPAMLKPDTAGYSESKGKAIASTGNQPAASTTCPAEKNKARVGSGVEESGSAEPRNQTVLQVRPLPTEAPSAKTVAEESGTSKQETAETMSKNPKIKEGTKLGTQCREQEKTVTHPVKLGCGDAKLNQKTCVVLEKIEDMVKTVTDVKLESAGALPKSHRIKEAAKIVAQLRDEKKTEDRPVKAGFRDAKLKQATVVELENIEGMLETLESMEEAGAAGDNEESRSHADEPPHGSSSLESVSADHTQNVCVLSAHKESSSTAGSAHTNSSPSDARDDGGSELGGLR